MTNCLWEWTKVGQNLAGAGFFQICHTDLSFRALYGISLNLGNEQ